MAANLLTVTLSDGTKVTYDLASLPKVTMANDKLVITSSSINAEYELYLVKTFKFNDASGIKGLNQDNHISREGDKLILSGVNHKISIFTTDGKLLPVDLIKTSESTIIDLSTFSHGIYIISVDGKSVKIAKQ
jgi:hypothetical protein